MEDMVFQVRKLIKGVDADNIFFIERKLSDYLVYDFKKATTSVQNFSICHVLSY